LCNIDQVIDDPAFGSHDQVEIAQAHIKVDDHHPLTILGESCAERGRRSRLADSALSGCHHDDLRHCRLLPYLSRVA
jgi:hypothetical protein